MGNPYYGYPPSAAADRGSIPRPSFPGYFSAEAPPLPSHHDNMQAATSDVQKRDISQMQPGMYGVNNISSSGVYPETNLGGLSVGATTRAYPSSLGDPSLGAQRWNSSGQGVLGVYPDPSSGGVSAGPPSREAPNLMGHRWDSPGISSSAGVQVPKDSQRWNSSGPGVLGVYPDTSFGGVSVGPPIREVPNLVGHRWDAPGISSSAGVHPGPSLGVVSAATSIYGYSSPLDVPSFTGQRQDVPVGTNSSYRLHPEPNLGVVSARASIKDYLSPRQESPLVDQRKDGPSGTKPGIPDALDEKTASVRNGACHTDVSGESNILFVDCLPTDCTRREVGHLFRSFTGYKDIKVIHKEATKISKSFTRNQDVVEIEPWFCAL